MTLSKVSKLFTGSSVGGAEATGLTILGAMTMGRVAKAIITTNINKISTRIRRQKGNKGRRVRRERRGIVSKWAIKKILEGL